MRFAKRMSRLGTETAFEVLARAKALEAQGRSICHLEIGEPDFATPDYVVAAGRAALEQGLTKYGPAAGLPELREAIAGDVSRRRNVAVDPAEVVIVPGAKPILFFGLLALVEPGDEVLVPDPGFPIYASVVAMAGGVPVPYRLDATSGFDIDTKTLRRARGGIFNTPHNPTGGVIDRAAWDAIAELDLDWIMSDEVYSRMVYDGEHASALSVPALRERTVLVDGFSKTWSMTGWRIGFGVMPPDLAEKVARLQINCTSCVPAFTQRAALAALHGPEDPVREMVAAFRARRDRITAGLNALPGVTCARPKGAFYVFPDVSAVGDSDEIAGALLEEEGVACLSGTAFGEAGRGFLRFSYAASERTIDDALARFANFLSQRG